MSDIEANSAKKRTLSLILKWSAAILAIIVLEAGGIAAAVKIAESRNADNANQLHAALNQIAAHDNQIANLEKLPHTISANEQQIAANAGMLNLLSENLNTLKAEVGNKKIDVVQQQMETLNLRMEGVEETKNEEALILSLVLIIKENALYNRSFSQEADILAEMGGNQKQITEDIRVINDLKNARIAGDNELIAQFNQLKETFSFEKPTIEESDSLKEDENRSAVSKSIDLIKDTVAGINFDKVVVIKKDKKTEEQKLLLQTLSELVNSHNFNDALAFIESNSQFDNAENGAFAEWREQVKQKIRFDNAVSKIIAAELNAIRKDFGKTQDKND